MSAAAQKGVFPCVFANRVGVRQVIANWQAVFMARKGHSLPSSPSLYLSLSLSASSSNSRLLRHQLELLFTGSNTNKNNNSSKTLNCLKCCSNVAHHVYATQRSMAKLISFGGIVIAAATGQLVKTRPQDLGNSSALATCIFT